MLEQPAKRATIDERAIKRSLFSTLDACLFLGRLIIVADCERLLADLRVESASRAVDILRVFLALFVEINLVVLLCSRSLSALEMLLAKPPEAVELSFDAMRGWSDFAPSDYMRIDCVSHSLAPGNMRVVDVSLASSLRGWTFCERLRVN